MLFFDALYGGPVANGFGFLVILHDSRNPFRGTVCKVLNYVVEYENMILPNPQK